MKKSGMRKAAAGLAALLSAFLMLFFTGIRADASTVYTEGYFYYTVSDESVTITGYFGKETETRVPAMIAGYPVNTIKNGAFLGTSLQTIILPDCIMVVEDGAFSDAQNVIMEGTKEETAESTVQAPEKPIKPAAETRPDGSSYNAPPEQNEEIELADPDLTSPAAASDASSASEKQESSKEASSEASEESEKEDSKKSASGNQLVAASVSGKDETVTADSTEESAENAVPGVTTVPLVREKPNMFRLVLFILSPFLIMAFGVVLIVIARRNAKKKQDEKIREIEKAREEK